MIANTSAVQATDDPVVMFDHPVILVGYMVNNTASALGGKTLIYDMAAVPDPLTDDPVLEIPAPAELGAVQSLQMTFVNGIAAYSPDTNNDPLLAHLTVAVFDPTL